MLLRSLLKVKQGALVVQLRACRELIRNPLVRFQKPDVEDPDAVMLRKAQ